MNWITLLLVYIAFASGYSFAKWDTKHGAAFGYKAGTWTWVRILRLPPIEETQDEKGE